jgi:hypothetical protein
MNVRQLIQHLMQSADMDAEVIVDAPLSASHGPVYHPTQHLIIPVASISLGTFQPGGTMEGKSWVSINGTSAWNQNRGIEDTNGQLLSRLPT